MVIAVAACCVFLAVLSVLRRAKSRRLLRRLQVPDEVRPSLLSEALKELVAVAGGIYLGLLMITSFLQIDVPGKVGWTGLSVEPLAALSFILAILQPFVGDLFGFARRFP